MLDAHKRPSVSISVGGALMSSLLSVAFTGCSDSAATKQVQEARTEARKTDQSVPDDQSSATTVGPPDRIILFQPMFVWAGSEPTYQGTGFFAKAPNNKIVAVTSAHFLNMNGPPLQEAKWLDVRTNKWVATFTLSWGTPGRSGTRHPLLDLRSDYLLMPASSSITPDKVLELDSRPKPKLKERIWFPNKDETAPLGHQVVAGSVVESDEKYSIVILDKEVPLQSQSGSPFISQATGKVIGTLSGADSANGQLRLLITPSSGILAMLAKDNHFPELRSVIGKKR